MAQSIYKLCSNLHTRARVPAVKTRRMSMLAAGVAALAVWPSSVLALDNGLVKVPWMGWSAWEVFRDTSPEQDPKRYVALHCPCTSHHAHAHTPTCTPRHA